MFASLVSARRALDEIAFPFKDTVVFEGLEGEGQLPAEPRALQREYLRMFGVYVAALRRGCREMGMDYVPVYENDDGQESPVSGHAVVKLPKWRQQLIVQPLDDRLRHTGGADDPIPLCAVEFLIAQFL